MGWRAKLPLALLALVAAASPLRGQVEIRLPDVVVAPEEVATVEITLHSALTDIGGVSSRFDWSLPVTVGNCRVNPDIERPASAFAYFPDGCEDDDSCGEVSAVLLAFSVAAPIPDGAVLYRCDLRVDSSENGTHPLRCVDAEAASLLAIPYDATCVDGRVEVVVPVATPTATATATLTSTPPPTPTVVTPPTATPQPCAGDCDGDRVVSVNELVLGVRIALGEADLALCPQFDTEVDAAVSISELIAAVGVLLEGCS